jgi:hypothetical protein
MMGRRFNFKLSAVVFVVMIAFAGCATVDKENTIDTERMLSASGFQMRMADTPQKLDKVKSMSQKKLIRHKQNGNIDYIYADAKDCKCFYVGTEKAYTKFREMAAMKLASDAASARDENVMIDWDVWGGKPGSDWRYWQ